jgi:cysteinyl-tRNA synthetase
MAPYEDLVLANSPLRLYDSLSRKVEAFDANGKVGLYVCGITPYDSAHLGHAFTYTVFDVLVRYLRYLGRKVTYVQNVTDIDDDILKRAFSTGVDWKELGVRETEKYLAGMAAINNLPPDVMPRATDHIPEMVEITADLLTKGLAYESGGSVYFEVGKAPAFGRLSRLSYQEQLAIANERGNYPDDRMKKDPLDFPLWQAKKEGEPYWPSPWGDGRPGWHIECSAMSMKYLGAGFALHGGGEDLLFPHHECEIIQSESHTGQQFVRFWLHTAMVYMGENKMSKSLGNMVFVPDLIQTCSGDCIRLYLLGHHYRTSFTFDAGELDRKRELAERLMRAAIDADEASEDELQHWGKDFLEAMADDLDTPAAIALLVRLADAPEPAAHRVLRTLGGRVLGLTFKP